ncbi:hypothetical protein V6N13_052932 [Hibiscus sabdariffa]
MATKPPLADGGNDMLGGKWSENRLFSVRSAYVMGDVQPQNVIDNVWTAISKFKGTPRIKMFLWLLVRETILTNLERV